MANFQYDAGMRETSRGLGNGLTQTINYNLDNTISQKSVAGITNFLYTYDQNKRKLTETDSIMTNLSQTFSYDFEDRLTSWTSNGTTLNQTQSWNLSLEGAWNSTTVNGNTENRTFNQAYEILTSNANAMSHDRKGNLTQNKDGSLYSWDFDNQLAFSTAGTPSVNASYAYDALGRRVSKSSGNTVTVFVHSNYQIATEYKSINGGAFTEIQSFVYATYIDDPIALISTNGTYFYHSNQQFSIAAITDSNGNLSERYGYNAYGKPVIITDSILVDNPYFFTGRQLDSETGLFYFRARYYEASLGQFISRDPLNYVEGMNLYGGYFVANKLDPSGKNSANAEAYAKCRERMNINEQEELKDFVELFKSSNCPLPSVLCLCCSGSESGSYSEETNVITLCYNNSKDFLRTLRHEMTHSYDDCIRKKQKEGKNQDDCFFKACTEIRAYSSGNYCNNETTPEDRKKCIIKNAMSSLKNVNGGICNSFLTESDWDNLYQNCNIPIGQNLSDLPFNTLHGIRNLHRD